MCCFLVAVDVCKSVSDPDATAMLPVALTSVSAPLIKETMRWQVASLPTLVIGPFLPTLSPPTKSPISAFSFLSSASFPPPISQKRASGQATTQDFVK